MLNIEKRSVLVLLLIFIIILVSPQKVFATPRAAEEKSHPEPQPQSESQPRPEPEPRPQPQPELQSQPELQPQERDTKVEPDRLDREDGFRALPQGQSIVEQSPLGQSIVEQSPLGQVDMLLPISSDAQIPLIYDTDVVPQEKPYWDEERPDGTKVKLFPSSVMVRNPDGTIVETRSDGTQVVIRPDGSSFEISPDGTISIRPPPIIIDASLSGEGDTRVEQIGGGAAFPGGVTIVTLRDGTIVINHEGGDVTWINPDGSRKGRNTDGSTWEKRPDDTYIQRNPDGSEVEIRPDGSSVRRTTGASEQSHRIPLSLSPQRGGSQYSPPPDDEKQKGESDEGTEIVKLDLKGGKTEPQKERERTIETPSGGGLSFEQQCGFYEKKYLGTVWTGWRAVPIGEVKTPTGEPIETIVWETTIYNAYEVTGCCRREKDHPGEHTPPKRRVRENSCTIRREETLRSGETRKPPPDYDLPKPEDLQKKAESDAEPPPK